MNVVLCSSLCSSPTGKLEPLALHVVGVVSSSILASVSDVFGFSVSFQKVFVRKNATLLSFFCFFIKNNFTK